MMSCSNTLQTKIPRWRIRTTGLDRLIFGVILISMTTAVAADRKSQPRPPAPPIAHRVCPLLIPADLVRPHVEYLASPQLQGRDGAGADQAADYIESFFRQQELEPLFDGQFSQRIPDGSGASGPDRTIGRNVGALLRGTDSTLSHEVILIGAHYDHLGIRGGQIYPGADDNASGVSMLLEAARYLTSLPHRPSRSIAFVAFDMEEELLYGSRWFVAHSPIPLQNIKLMMTADLIGRSLGDLPLPLVFVFGMESAVDLPPRFAAIGTPNGLEVGRLGADFIGTRSDYGPFRDHRIPFLFFSTGEQPDYHTPNDLPEKIDYDKLASISSLMVALLEQVANDPITLSWNAEPTPDMEEARSLERVTETLLDEETAGRRKLSTTVRFVASQMLAKVRYMQEQGRLSAQERTWLVRSAQFLLLNAF